MRPLFLALLGAVTVARWAPAEPPPTPVEAGPAGHLFPPGTYVLGGGPETATAKHAAAVRERFALHPDQYVLSGGPEPTASRTKLANGSSGPTHYTVANRRMWSRMASCGPVVNRSRRATLA